MPVWHESYAQLHLNLEWTDFVRLCILESALDLTWLASKRLSPARVREAMRDLDSINDQIQASAGQLLSLLGQRDQLLLEYSLTDDPDGDYLDMDPPEDWVELLRDLSERRRPLGVSVDPAMTTGLSSETNSTEWSRWALAFLGKIERWGPFPEGFLRSCLSRQQLATLLEVAVNAPAGVFNPDQLGKLEARWRLKLLDKSDSDDLPPL